MAVIGFSMVGCDLNNEEEGSGTLGGTLSKDVWKNGELKESGQTREYSISVTSGTYYFIWWNDSYSGGGDGTKTADISVSARYDNGTGDLFTKEDRAWDGFWANV